MLLALSEPLPYLTASDNDNVQAAVVVILVKEYRNTRKRLHSQGSEQKMHNAYQNLVEYEGTNQRR